MVRVVVDSARKGSPVRLPWVGASFQEVTSDIAEGLGIERPRGVLIVEIVSGSPAERAKLTTGDLVISVDGIEINDEKSLNYRLATKGIGATVRIGIIRSKKEYYADLALEAAPETVPRDQVEITSGSPLVGATVVNLSPAVAEELAYGGDSDGVIVSAVADGSPAARTGLRPGDVILDVNGVPIETTRQLVAATSERARLWNMTIERDGRILRSRISG
jgi:S1-C subfamily serine protease